MEIIKKLSGNTELKEIPPIFYDDQLIYDEKTKTETFNNYFNRISTLDLQYEPVIDHNQIINHSEYDLDFIIEVQEVEDQIKLLNTKKAYGSDSISPHLLKINSDNLNMSLCKIFNAS